MPRKERMLKEAEARAEAERMDAMALQMPEWMKARVPEVKLRGNVFANAADGLPGKGLLQGDEYGNAVLHEEHARGASEAKAERMWSTINALREHYRKHEGEEFWFSRSAAKKIAAESKEVLGLKKPLSVSTIRRYIALSRQSNRLWVAGRISG